MAKTVIPDRFAKRNLIRNLSLNTFLTPQYMKNVDNRDGYIRRHEEPLDISNLQAQIDSLLDRIPLENRRKIGLALAGTSALPPLLHPQPAQAAENSDHSFVKIQKLDNPNFDSWSSIAVQLTEVGNGDLIVTFKGVKTGDDTERLWDMPLSSNGDGTFTQGEVVLNPEFNTSALAELDIRDLTKFPDGRTFLSVADQGSTDYRIIDVSTGETIKDGPNSRENYTSPYLNSDELLLSGSSGTPMSFNLDTRTEDYTTFDKQGLDGLACASQPYLIGDETFLILDADYSHNGKRDLVEYRLVDPESQAWGDWEKLKSLNTSDGDNDYCLVFSETALRQLGSYTVHSIDSDGIREFVLGKLELPSSPSPTPEISPTPTPISPSPTPSTPSPSPVSASPTPVTPSATPASPTPKPSPTPTESPYEDVVIDGHGNEAEVIENADLTIVNLGDDTTGNWDIEFNDDATITFLGSLEIVGGSDKSLTASSNDMPYGVSIQWYSGWDTLIIKNTGGKAIQLQCGTMKKSIITLNPQAKYQESISNTQAQCIIQPTPSPTATVSPSVTPIVSPTASPSFSPTASPTPSDNPTPSPTVPSITNSPTPPPVSPSPTPETPSATPDSPTAEPSATPNSTPSDSPNPTGNPTTSPIVSTTPLPTNKATPPSDSGGGGCGGCAVLDYNMNNPSTNAPVGADAFLYSALLGAVAAERMTGAISKTAKAIRNGVLSLLVSVIGEKNFLRDKK